MRVISMVPSWTETLLECGVNVVGRTRYCIHPAGRARAIAVVGGTKDIDWQKVDALQADLLLLDKEENPQSMAESARLPIVTTHIRSVVDVPLALRELSARFPAQAGESLSGLASQWDRELQRPAPELSGWEQLSGVREWVKSPSVHSGDRIQEPYLYVIWKDPWMTVGRQTFIASMLNLIGLPQELSLRLPGREQAAYPEFTWADVPMNAVLLFASEPFPFHKKKAGIPLDRLNGAAIVDGECFSWFGVRALRFLQARG